MAAGLRFAIPLQIENRNRHCDLKLPLEGL